MDIRYERFCFPVTFRCNLNCKLCAEHAPYAERPYHPTLKFLKEEVDQLFALVEYIGKFDITGGEPFLRNDLADILNYLHMNYRQKIGMVRVTTNGTLLPPEGFLQAMVNWKKCAYVIVDHYAVSKQCKAVYKQLQDVGIPSELRDYSDDIHCDGWVDYGDLSLKHTREEAKDLFKKCLVPKLGFFTCMVNGILFPCARARLLYEKFINNVGVDLFDPELTVQGKKARMCSLLDGKEVVDACRFCNGLCEDSPRFLPAEQLNVSRKEARKRMEYEDWRLDYGKMVFYTQTYNNEATIARTIESVLNQTNPNFTYFICNNASTDRTGEIIKKYADSDSRIVCVQCENNDILGTIKILENLLGALPINEPYYHTIIDGDDSIEPDFVERILALAEKEEPDMIVSAVNRIDADSGRVLNQRKAEYDMVVEGYQKAENFLQFRSMLLCQWGKVYRHSMGTMKTKLELFYKNAFQIPVWFHHMDTVMVLCAFCEYDKIGFISKPIYNYYISTGSTYHNYFPDRIKSDVLMFRIYMDFLQKYPPVDSRNYDFCYAIYFSLIEDTVRSILAAPIDEGQRIADLLEVLRAEPTVDLFSRAFDSMFNNLAHRETILQPIFEYVQGIGEMPVCKEECEILMAEINRYHNILISRKGE